MPWVRRTLHLRDCHYHEFSLAPTYSCVGNRPPPRQDNCYRSRFQLGRPAARSIEIGCWEAIAITTADQPFAREAAMGGMAQVELGNLGKEEGVERRRETVRRWYGHRPRQGQRRAEAVGAADEGHVCRRRPTRSTKRPAIGWQNSGDAFDKAYMRDMVMDDQPDVAAFKREAESAKDARCPRRDTPCPYPRSNVTDNPIVGDGGADHAGRSLLPRACGARTCWQCRDRLVESSFIIASELRRHYGRGCAKPNPRLS